MDNIIEALNSVPGGQEVFLQHIAIRYSLTPRLFGNLDKTEQLAIVYEYLQRVSQPSVLP